MRNISAYGLGQTTRFGDKKNNGSYLPKYTPET